MYSLCAGPDGTHSDMEPNIRSRSTACYYDPGEPQTDYNKYSKREENN